MAVPVPPLEPRCGSWIIVDQLKQEALAECFVRKTVDRLAALAIPGRVEILTAAQWLGRFNRAVKAAGGVQPTVDQLTAAAAVPI